MYCQKCGCKLQDGVKFCGQCGAEQISEKTEMAFDSAINETLGFCCPDCGNLDLQVTTETETSTSGKNFSATQGCLGYCLMGPLGILCGACGQKKRTHSKNTTFFVCSKCGRKFQNPRDLAAAEKSTMRYFWFCAVFVEIVTLIVSTVMLSRFYNELGELVPLTFFLGTLPLLMGTLAGIIVVLFGYALKKARMSEIRALEEGMNKFRSSGADNEA